METFDYISVMISIILGLGIANVLNTIGILIRNKHKVIHSTTYYLQSTFIVLLNFQAWWTVFGYKDYPHWDFFFYLLVLVLTSLIYLTTEMLKVDENQEVINLQATFMKHKTIYLLIFVISVLCGGFIQSIVTDSTVFTKINIFRILMVSFGVWGAFSSSEKVQNIVALAFLILFTMVIVGYRLNLGELSQ